MSSLRTYKRDPLGIQRSNISPGPSGKLPRTVPRQWEESTSQFQTRLVGTALLQVGSQGFLSGFFAGTVHFGALP